MFGFLKVYLSLLKFGLGKKSFWQCLEQGHVHLSHSLLSLFLSLFSLSSLPLSLSLSLSLNVISIIEWVNLILDYEYNDPFGALYANVSPAWFSPTLNSVFKDSSLTDWGKAPVMIET